MDRMYLGIINLENVESSAFEVPCAARLGFTQSTALPLARVDCEQQRWRLLCFP